MKRFLIGLAVIASAMAVTITEADAKRLGGGGSFGRQSQSYSRQQAPAQAQRPAAPPAAAPQGVPPKPASPWKNILGGALLGLGLGALLSHFGLSGAAAGMISTLLMLALLAVAIAFILRMFRRKTEEPRPAYVGSYSGTPEIGSRLDAHPDRHLDGYGQPANLQSPVPVSAGAAVPWGVPADFDAAAFLRSAKTYFIRLQAAWDRADINDIREFTTPEMFAELRLQIQERGASPNNTDVVSLDAELLGVETVGDEYLASVKFSGMIKEEENAPAAPFSEIWNLAKPVSGPGGWVLAGIQQTA